MTILLLSSRAEAASRKKAPRTGVDLAINKLIVCLAGSYSAGCNRQSIDGRDASKTKFNDALVSNPTGCSVPLKASACKVIEMALS
jgi:hypothetical protein